MSPTSCSSTELVDAVLDADSFSLPVLVHGLNMHLIASAEASMSHESLCTSNRPGTFENSIFLFDVELKKVLFLR